ncbi:hypothetical protein SAMN05421882_100494 [Nitrosomonas communis]|uniref:Uncharacterized protein n=1 Tax=Nitrosomonas communis TaxID=44574 RepID=A0A1H2RFR3_9PROT|nr:hypothetical protein SAMN05421882_100494 [Nitrosomonas communis]
MVSMRVTMYCPAKMFFGNDLFLIVPEIQKQGIYESHLGHRGYRANWF